MTKLEQLKFMWELACPILEKLGDKVSSIHMGDELDVTNFVIYWSHTKNTQDLNIYVNIGRYGHDDSVSINASFVPISFWDHCHVELNDPQFESKYNEIVDRILTYKAD